jgi:hypothetical protein
MFVREGVIAFALLFLSACDEAVPMPPLLPPAASGPVAETLKLETPATPQASLSESEIEATAALARRMAGRPPRPPERPAAASTGQPAPHWGWLGVAVALPESSGPLDGDRGGGPGQDGAVVHYVRRGSPAETAGIVPADVIVKIGGIPFAEAVDAARGCIVCTHDTFIEIVVLRGGRKLTLHATPIDTPSEVEGAVDAKTSYRALAACVHDKSCPRGERSMARQRASEDFACPLRSVEASQVDVDRDPIQGTLRETTDTGGSVEVVVLPETTKVFEVHGCGHVAMMSCFRGHRAVRDSEEKHEGDHDRVCVWTNESALGLVI